jgi:outer membrane receptor for ferrienterochelin and colicins
MYALMALSLFGASPLLAQSGTVSGRTTDHEGRPLPSVQVLAIAQDGRTAASGYTGNDGRYRMAVPAGTYLVRFQVIGYREADATGVVVPAGGAAVADMTLQPAAVTIEQLVVTASKSEEKAIDAPSTTFSIDQSQIRARPTVSPVDHLRAVPGVDIISYGLQGANITTRGFNNIFSGSLHMLTDHRLAHIPSLRVNLAHFVPTNNEDLDRIEVILGPGSALYGPNTASGVMHMITRSPLDGQGTAFSLAGGARDFLQGEFRTAQMVTPSIGVKLSGRYMRATEWQMTDSAEVRAKRQADTNPAFRQALLLRGLTNDEVNARFGRIANRDFSMEQWGGEARVDWMSSRGIRSVLSGGMTNIGKGIELTGLGAGLARDWSYSFLQARTSYNEFFAQAYLNMSDAGDTYTLKDGEAVVDESRLFVAQVQHGLNVGGRAAFTYGADFIRTMPESRGTIYGQFEDDANMTEMGGYVQGRFNVMPRLDLVAAGRVDTHSELESAVFSPRAALVFRAAEQQTVRLSYNRAFSTPTAINLFLDKSGGVARGLEALLFLSRGQGTGRDGYRFQNPDGSLTGMRSPFTRVNGQAAPATLLPANGQTLVQFWDAAIGVVAAQSGGQISPALVQYISSIRPTAANPIGIDVRNLLSGEIRPLAQSPMMDIEPIRESITSTIELGYQANLWQRLQVSAGVWRSDYTNFTSPLIPVTPLLQLSSTDVIAYLVPRLTPVLMAQGLPAATAEATARGIAAGMASVPLAVVSSDMVNAVGADIMATYVNAGDVTLNGFDAALRLTLTPNWSVSGGGSWVSDDHVRIPFGGVDQIVALNASPLKLNGGVHFQHLGRGLTGEVRARHSAEFPANSADYVGVNCLNLENPPPGAENCVASATIVDLNFGYRLPVPYSPTVQLSVTNIFDEPYRAFVGVPEIGRFAMLRLRYEF